MPFPVVAAALKRRPLTHSEQATVEKVERRRLRRKLKREPWRAFRDAPPPDQVLIGWLHKTCYRQYWRVAGIMELDDFVQEGYLCYCYCRNLYGNNLPPQQFMTLFQRAFGTRITDASNLRTRIRSHEISECELSSGTLEDDSDTSPLDRLVDAEDTGDLNGILQVISDAPSQAIRDFLCLFLGDGAASLLLPYKRTAAGERETTNEFLCRILGLNPKAVGDLVGQTKAYLRGSLHGNF